MKIIVMLCCADRFDLMDIAHHEITFEVEFDESVSLTDKIYQIGQQVIEKRGELLTKGYKKVGIPARGFFPNRDIENDLRDGVFRRLSHIPVYDNVGLGF